MEYYVAPNNNDRITVADLNLSAVQLTFLDENDDVLTDLVEYVLVIGVDYMDRDPPNAMTVMRR
jgi:hypothetical protein